MRVPADKRDAHALLRTRRKHGHPVGDCEADGSQQDPSSSQQAGQGQTSLLKVISLW